MAARRPFWKWRCWKSIGSYPYTWVLCRWSLKLIFKAKLKLESRNQKIQYGRQAAILKATSLKINRLLPMTSINMHMKLEIEIPKKTWLMLRKPCRLQTDGRTDGQTDRRTRWIQYTPPPTSLGGGIIMQWALRINVEYASFIANKLDIRKNLLHTEKQSIVTNMASTPENTPRFNYPELIFNVAPHFNWSRLFKPASGLSRIVKTSLFISHHPW